jgi:hypothetical protein
MICSLCPPFRIQSLKFGGHGAIGHISGTESHKIFVSGEGVTGTFGVERIFNPCFSEILVYNQKITRRNNHKSAVCTNTAVKTSGLTVIDLTWRTGVGTCEVGELFFSECKTILRP